MFDREAMRQEADAWFERNRESIDQMECSAGIRLFSGFYDRCKGDLDINRMLEIGCSSGYNLEFLKCRYGMDVHGIEPSEKAVRYGTERMGKMGLDIDLRQGFSDSLPYEDSFFDAVCLGFCMYQVDRSMLYRTFSEVDRVLAAGGYA